jgi:thiol:disulfide interchange protein DsbG
VWCGFVLAKKTNLRFDARTGQVPRSFCYRHFIFLIAMTLKFLRNVFPAVFVAVSLALAGCNDAPGTATVKADPTPVSIAAIAAEAKGFTVGTPMSTRTVYVFFDPQCPHCAVLWQAAKPLKSQTKFVWIPVGLINPSSTAQGATLLAAKDPVALMDEHETSMLAKRGGISAGSDIDAQKVIVAKNTELMNRFGFTSIPSIVAMHAQTGAQVSREGGLPTVELAAFLGLQAPAQ